MNVIYFIAVILIAIIIVLTAFIDDHHMKNMIAKYGKDSNIYDAYKKGATMGVIKTILLSGLFYIIILSISVVVNNQNMDNYMKANTNFILNKKGEIKLNDMNNYNVLFENDTIVVDSIDKHTYIIHKTNCLINSQDSIITK